jgi:acyl carrier protein
MAMSAYSDIRDIRTFIADQLGIASELVTDELHFADDLECDWLDRLELAIAIEERFGVELTQEEVDRIELVGDFIRHVENDLKSRNQPVISPPKIAPRGHQW